MSKATGEFLRKIAIVPLIAAGVAGVLLMNSMRKSPQRVPLSEAGRRVRVIKAEPITVVPAAVGYGVAKAGTQWQMVSEVSGRVIEMSSELKAGVIVKKGTKLLSVDTEDYKLTETQLQANLDSVSAQVQESRVKEASTRANLKIESRSLELARRELERVRGLAASGALAQADVDKEERNVLSQEKVVQSLRNTLRELPANRRVLQAESAQQKAVLKGASLDIERTDVVAPYDVRVSEVKTELQEVVSQGQVLAIADGIKVAEIPAQIAPAALRPLIPVSLNATRLSLGQLSKLPDLAGIEAIVRLKQGDVVAKWKAKFDRFSNFSSQTRTIGVVVRVEDPFGKARPGVRPPIVPGMSMEVEVRGRPREGCLALPRSALHGRRVYVVGEENRLTMRDVVIDFSQAEFVCIRSGIEAGERVVVTDLVPAIEGMLLEPMDDPRTVEALHKATGATVQDQGSVEEAI